MARGATTESTTSSDPAESFEEAFDRAREEHSAEPEHAAADEASTQDDDEAADTTEATEEARPSARGKAATSDTTGLLTDEEFTALSTTHKDDPAALRRSLESAFTKKTQQMAAERRSHERLSQYAELVDALEDDAPSAIRALAKQFGLTVAGADADETETATATGETTEQTVATALDGFKKALGPELEYLADGLGPAVTKLVEQLTQSTISKAVEPVKKATDAMLSKSAADQTVTVMKSFGEKHPDWQDHEEAMMKLSERIQPKGMTELEYLEHLYETVTKPSRDKDLETRVAEGVKAALKKIEKGAQSTERRSDGVPDSHVKNAAPANATFDDAVAAAKRGERWE
jgi:hypothetical protein